MVGLRVSKSEYEMLSRYAKADKRSMANFARLIVQKALIDIRQHEEAGLPAAVAIASLKNES